MSRPSKEGLLLTKSPLLLLLVRRAEPAPRRLDAEWLRRVEADRRLRIDVSRIDEERMEESRMERPWREFSAILPSL